MGVFIFPLDAMVSITRAPESIEVIKNIQIKYDMYNLANIIYDYLGKNDQDFNYQLSPYFPELRRLTSLSINWIFRD